MGIFLRQSYNVPPLIWGSPDEVRFSIWDNLEDIYGCDHKSEALIMPGFWGFPMLDYSVYGNKPVNYGATYKNGSLDFDGNDYVGVGSDIGMVNTAGTISVLFKSNITSSANYIIAHRTGDAENTRIYLYVDNSNNDDFACGFGNAYNAITSDNNVNGDGEFHLGTIVWTSTGAIGYLDRNSIGTYNYELSAANGIVRIGANAQTTPGDYFNGLIKETRIAKAARTTDQIGLFYDNPYGLYRRVAKPIWSIPSGLTLTIAAIDSAGLLDSVPLTQKHNLAVQELSGVGSLDNISLSQKHLLVLQELLSSGALDNVALIQKHILSVQELAGAGTLENVELTQKHILALQDLSSSGTLDNIVLELSTLLVVAGLISDGLLDNISLTQKHNLVVQELLSSGELDNITLSVSTLLIVAEMISSGALDGVNLTQKHTIAVQELLSSGVLDDLSLTQKHLLVVQELLSAGAIDNIELLVATLLTVSDMLSTGAIDNTALTQKHILSINEVLSAGQIDGLALTQKHLLIIDSLISSGIIDNIRFDIAAGLIYISLSDATEYNISLSDATEYNISLSEAGGGIQ